MTHLKTAAAARALCAIAVLYPGGITDAKPLDKSACAALFQDIENFKLLDIGKLMENGPAWAQAHLGASDLDTVRRYLDADAQVKFRCTPPRQLVTLKAPLPDDEEGPPAPKKAEAASAGSKPLKESGDSAGTAPPADVDRHTKKTRNLAVRVEKKAAAAQAKATGNATAFPPDR